MTKRDDKDRNAKVVKITKWVRLGKPERTVWEVVGIVMSVSFLSEVIVVVKIFNCKSLANRASRTTGSQ